MNSIPFFISSHSSRGFVSFYDENYASLSTKIVLTGWPQQQATQLLEAIESAALKKEVPVWKILHSLDASIEGIILPQQTAGIFFSRPWDNALSDGTALTAAYQPVRQYLEEAHHHFAAALPIHDQWEAIYIQNMDYQALDQLTEKTVSSLLSKGAGGESGTNRMRFLGAATKDGSVDVIDEITSGLEKRIFIKGRPGTGKSTFLKKLRAAANESGWDTEEYRCAFDPNSADMVVIRKMGLCFFDSTAPHEHFPSRPGDEILDIYEAAVAPGTDERYESELKKIAADYKNEIRQATAALHSAYEAWNHVTQTADWDEDAIEKEKQRIFSFLF